MRPRTALFASAITLITNPVFASDLDSRYDAIGEMTVTLGTDTLTLVVPYDREKDTAYADQKMIMNSFLTLNTVARAVGADGKPGRPMVQITLQQRMGRMDLISAELFDDQGFDAPMTFGVDGGDGELVEYSFENNRLEAAVTGDFIRLEGYSTGQPKVADGASPVPVEIRWSVDIPPME